MHETKKLTSIEHFSFSRYAGIVIGRQFSKRFRCYKRFDQTRFDCILYTLVLLSAYRTCGVTV